MATKNNMSSYKVDANKLAKLRMDAFLTQREVAEKSGITRETLARMETLSDKYFVSNSVKSVAKVLNVNPNELIKSEED